MISVRNRADLRTALARLEAAQSCAAWDAIESLHALTASPYDFTIDLSASAAIGAPLVVARPRDPAWLGDLTPARARVARQLLAGLSNKAIARGLNLSVATVKDHVHAILSATGFRSRSELLSSALSARPRP